ncbi:MAG: D-2-hydroxyacid dehydrogenase [Dehalococcoidia bacterium]|nr:D-2-hydroxyacid dehydrogenase [Dehalococcoidia bacterium]
MDFVNVMVVSKISEESKRQIEAVSPRIKLRDTSHLWNAVRIRDSSQKDDFSSPEFDEILSQAEVIYGFKPPKNVVARAPKLKWIQCMLAGVEFFLDEQLVRSRVTVTNMSGIHATAVGEVVLEMMLMLAKHATVFCQQKRQRLWQRFIPEVLRDKTVGIMGLGSIGKEVARLSKAFGMRVLATRRSARRGQRARNVDRLLPRADLPELLSESDFVVVTLPLTQETNKMLSAQEFRMMKPTAHFINVGRGETVDEDALIRALEERRFAGAGLDAFATEPLPESSKLWELPNVFISPHVSGILKDYDKVINKLFCENLRRYLGGKRLLNVVNKKIGY